MRGYLSDQRYEKHLHRMEAKLAEMKELLKQKA